MSGAGLWGCFSTGRLESRAASSTLLRGRMVPEVGEERRPLEVALPELELVLGRGEAGASWVEAVMKVGE